MLKQTILYIGVFALGLLGGLSWKRIYKMWKRTMGYIAVLVVVFAFGFWLGHIELSAHKTAIDKIWEPWHRAHEDAVHEDIMRLQSVRDALVRTPTDGARRESLDNDIKTQLAIEELIIKSREGEYASWTLVSASVTALLVAVLGAVVTIVARRGS